MSYEVVWAELAFAQAMEILDQIEERDPRAARRLVTRIFARADMLSAFPMLGPRYRGADDPNLRELLVGSYRLMYEVDQVREKVTILTVRHGRQRPLDLGVDR